MTGASRWQPGWIVLGWAGFNLILIVVLVVLRGTVLEIVLYAVMTALVTGFGSAVLLAFARGRTGQQYRQPISSFSAFCAAAVLVLLGWGVVYHWWIALLGLYPLAGVWRRVGPERLAAATSPRGPTSTGEEAADEGLASAPRLAAPHTSPGIAEAVPATHPAHAPPQPGRLLRLLFVGLALVLRLRRRRAAGDQSAHEQARGDGEP